MPDQPQNFTIDFPPNPEQPLAPTSPSSPLFNTPAMPGTRSSVPLQPPGVTLHGAGITVAYIRDRGLRGAPVSGPYGSRAAFWRVHGGLVYKTVSCVFQAIGGPPTLPSPATNANEVLLADAVTIPGNEVMADGTPIYVRTVQFTFLLQTPPADTDALYGCVIQLDTTALSSNVVNPADYIPNLLGPIPTPAGFTGQAIGF